MRASPTLYCLMVCNKVGHYLKVVYNKELIRMDVEFHKDQFGHVWFYHCRDVWVREKNDWIKNHDERFSRFILSEIRKEQKPTTQAPLVHKEEEDPKPPSTPALAVASPKE